MFEQLVARHSATAARAAFAAAAVTHILLEPSWIQIVLAVVAFVGLSRDPRLGPLGAAVLLVVALPYDRAANSGLLRIAGIPLRPHDIVIGLALIAALAGVRRVRLSGTAPAVVVFVLVGLLALVIGFIQENAVRDILRDARWWFLYVTALFVLGTRMPTASQLRAVLWGATVFAVLAIAATILPTMDGSLKDRALIYDRGTLRMQFGNTTFLVLAAAYAAWRYLDEGSPRVGGWLFLLVAALALALTRMLLIVSVVALAGTAVWWLVTRRHRSSGPTWRPVAALSVTVAIGLVGGVAISMAHPLLEMALAGIQQDGGTHAPGEEPEDPLDRFLFRGERSGTEAIASGRLSTYRDAFFDISEHPILGTGLGTLVDIGYTFGGEEFDTPGKLPNVDNAYLTVGLKAGIIGIAAFAAMFLAPLIVWWRTGIDRLWMWLPPAWIGLLGLTMTQSFAVTGYSPFVLSMLVVGAGGSGYAASRRSRATDGA